MLRDINGDLPTNKEWVIAVTDDAGEAVATLRVLAIRRPRSGI
jgi:hypothetical protein